MNKPASALVGRGVRADIQLTDPSVSRLHAEITFSSNGEYFVTDCGSSGGTYVFDGGAWVTVRQSFVPGHAPLRLGGFETTAAELWGRHHNVRKDLRPRTPARSAGQHSLPSGSVRRNPATGDLEPKR